MPLARLRRSGRTSVASTRRMVTPALPSVAATRLTVSRTAMLHVAAVLAHPATFGAAAGRAYPLRRIALLAGAAVQVDRAVREAAAGIRARVLLAPPAIHVMHRPAILPAVHAGMAMRRTRDGEERKRGYQNSYTRHAHDFVLLKNPGYAAARRRQVEVGGRNRRIVGRYSSR